MLVMNPQSVRFGAALLAQVRSVAFDRQSIDPLEQWGAGGPWCRLADSTRRRVTVSVRQHLSAPDIGEAPALGAQQTLEVFVSPAAGSRRRRRISAVCVVIGVRHELAAERESVRTVTLLAVSTGPGAGATDPVTVQEVFP